MRMMQLGEYLFFGSLLLLLVGVVVIVCGLVIRHKVTKKVGGYILLGSLVSLSASFTLCSTAGHY